MDTSYGSIQIGGPLPKDPAVLSQLAQLLEESGRPVEGTPTRQGWLRPYFQVDDQVHLVSGTLALEDFHAPYGHFERLEVFCREHAIPYDQHSDGVGEYDAVNSLFRPCFAPAEMPEATSGDAHVFEFISSNTMCGEHYVSRDDLLKILDGPESVEEKLVAIRRRLVADIPPLPLILWGALEEAEDRVTELSALQPA